MDWLLKSRSSKAASSIIVLIGLAIFPILISNIFYVNLMILIGIYMILTLGLSLIFGYAGQLSLTQAAFYGIGAYTSAILTTNLHLPVWIGLVAAAIVTGIFAYLLGAPILRLKHYYLAMASLAFGEIMVVLATQQQDLTGGSAGIASIPAPSVGGFQLDTPSRYYYLVWVIAILVLVFSQNIVSSKIGRALQAISASEEGAAAMGVNVAKYKVLMFTLSGIYAGIAGSLYVHYVTYVNPDSFTVSLSILLLIMVAVGGAQSLWGAVLGAVFITILPPLVGMYQRYNMLIYGVLLLAVLMFLPGGLAGGISALLKKVTGRFSTNLQPDMPEISPQSTPD